MTESQQRAAIALADTLDRAANDAAALHYDMRSHSEWGTGTTVGIERKLAAEASALRDLVAQSQLTEAPADDDDGECEGHETTRGPIGSVFYCDGSCRL